MRITMPSKRLAARAWRCLLALAAALPLLAAAAPQLIAPFQGPVPKTQKAKPFHSEGARIQFNIAQLRNVVPGQDVELTLPDGSKHALVLDLLQDQGGGITSWIGHYKDATPLLRTVITTGPGGSFGRIVTPDNEYSIVPGDGFDWLVDLKAEKPFLPKIDLRNDAHIPKGPKPKSSVAPESAAPEAIDLVPGVNSPVVAKSAAAIVAPTPGVVVDILMAYTSGLATALGPNLQTRLAQLIASANTAFADSGVAITMRMVGSAQVSYSDVAKDSTGALVDITPGQQVADSNDPLYDPYGVASAFSNIESLRTQYGADMVTLLRNGDAYGGDGVAWVGGATPSAQYMYSVMTGCTASCDWVWVHELGHNFGSAHDRATNAWENGGSNVPGAYSYSYGYYSCQGGRFALTCDAFSGLCTNGEPECSTGAAGTNNFSDIMAYFQGSTSKNTVYFSNPALVACQGQTGPAAACGSAVGNVDEANAALTLNNTRVAMSQLKPTVVPLTAATTTTLTSSLNPAPAGTAVTFTATVTAASGTPTGSVNFLANGTSIAGCAAVALSSGVATCAASSLTSGTIPVTAAYSGSSTYSASTSAVLSQVVNAKLAPSVSLYSSGNYVPVGTAVTLTVGIGPIAANTSATVTFLDGTTTLCANVAPVASQAMCTVSSLAIGDHTIKANYSGNTAYAPASLTLVQTMLNTARTGETNVALASTGASASASSTYNANFPAAGAINGDRKGLAWSNGGGWADATADAYPDWIQVNFAGTRSIDSVGVYTVQDNWSAPVEPSDTLTFTQYGVVDFTVQGWDGSQWVTLATVTGNNLVKRVVAFNPFITDRIRVNVTRALNSLSRVTEIEAFGIPATAPPPPTNVALASAGAVATASSSYGAGYPAAAAIDGEHNGVNWSAGGGWADGTVGAFPDWLQVDFAAPATIDHVVLYTVQDNWQSPTEPTDTTTFSLYGIRDFTVQGWDGTQWVLLANVAGNYLVKRTLTFPAMTTSRIRVTVTNALNGLSRITEVEAWGTLSAPTGPTGTDMALAANGGTASASSQYSANYPPGATIDGDRKGLNWSAGGGWADGTVGAYPDWLEVDFNGSKTLNTVIVYTLQDNWQSPVEPTDTMTFTQYGVTDFTVQAWDGAQWQTVATVTGNNRVKRSVPVSVTTTKIRINVTNALSSLSRITEVEAWGVAAASAPTGTDVALAANGGTASASSQYSASYPPSATIDGDRKGLNWSAGGGWADGTASAYPDWLEVDFNGSKTLNTVIVYTLQDNWQAPVEPTDTMTFSQYGVTDFTVQAWNGTQWQTVATVAGNNLVKRSVPVSVTTTKIRVNVTNALSGLARITEVEAWGN